MIFNECQAHSIRKKNLHQKKKKDASSTGYTHTNEVGSVPVSNIYIYSKWVKDLSANAKTIKLSEENKGMSLCPWIRQQFLR